MSRTSLCCALRTARLGPAIEWNRVEKYVCAGNVGRSYEMNQRGNANNGYSPRLKDRYFSELQARLKDEMGLRNVMQVPRPEKVVVNMGVGEASRDAKLLDG